MSFRGLIEDERFEALDLKGRNEVIDRYFQANPSEDAFFLKEAYNIRYKFNNETEFNKHTLADQARALETYREESKAAKTPEQRLVAANRLTSSYSKIKSLEEEGFKAQKEEEESLEEFSRTSIEGIRDRREAEGFKGKVKDLLLGEEAQKRVSVDSKGNLADDSLVNEAKAISSVRLPKEIQARVEELEAEAGDEPDIDSPDREKWVNVQNKIYDLKREYVVEKSREEFKEEQSERQAVIFLNKQEEVEIGDVAGLVRMSEEELSEEVERLGTAPMAKARFDNLLKKEKPKMVSEISEILKREVNRERNTAGGLGKALSEWMGGEEPPTFDSEEEVRKALKDKEAMNVVNKALIKGGKKIDSSVSSMIGGALDVAAIEAQLLGFDSAGEFISKGARELSKDSQEIIEEQSLIDAGKGVELASDVIGMVPDIASYAIPGRALSKLGGKINLSKNAIEKLAKIGGSTASGLSAGLRTVNEVKDMGLSDEAAITYGLRSTLINGLTTVLAGRGAEDVLSPAVKGGVKKTVDDYFKAVMGHSGTAAKGAMDEIPEEVTATILESVFIQMEIDPTLTPEKMVDNGFHAMEVAGLTGSSIPLLARLANRGSREREETKPTDPIEASERNISKEIAESSVASIEVKSLSKELEEESRGEEIRRVVSEEKGLDLEDKEGNDLVAEGREVLSFKTKEDAESFNDNSLKGEGEVIENPNVENEYVIKQAVERGVDPFDPILQQEKSDPKAPSSEASSRVGDEFRGGREALPEGTAKTPIQDSERGRLEDSQKDGVNGVSKENEKESLLTESIIKDEVKREDIQLDKREQNKQPESSGQAVNRLDEQFKGDNEKEEGVGSNPKGSETSKGSLQEKARSIEGRPRVSSFSRLSEEESTRNPDEKKVISKIEEYFEGEVPRNVKVGHFSHSSQGRSFDGAYDDNSREVIINLEKVRENTIVEVLNEEMTHSVQDDPDAQPAIKKVVDSLTPEERSEIDTELRENYSKGERQQELEAKSVRKILSRPEKKKLVERLVDYIKDKVGLNSDRTARRLAQDVISMAIAKSNGHNVKSIRATGQTRFSKKKNRARTQAVGRKTSVFHDVQNEMEIDSWVERESGLEELSTDESIAKLTDPEYIKDLQVRAKSELNLEGSASFVVVRAQMIALDMAAQRFTQDGDTSKLIAFHNAMAEMGYTSLEDLVTLSDSARAMRGRRGNTDSILVALSAIKEEQLRVTNEAFDKLGLEGDAGKVMESLNKASRKAEVDSDGDLANEVTDAIEETPLEKKKRENALKELRAAVLSYAKLFERAKQRGIFSKTEKPISQQGLDLIEGYEEMGIEELGGLLGKLGNLADQVTFDDFPIKKTRTRKSSSKYNNESEKILAGLMARAGSQLKKEGSPPKDRSQVSILWSQYTKGEIDSGDYIEGLMSLEVNEEMAEDSADFGEEVKSYLKRREIAAKAKREAKKAIGSKKYNKSDRILAGLHSGARYRMKKEGSIPKEKSKVAVLWGQYTRGEIEGIEYREKIINQGATPEMADSSVELGRDVKDYLVRNNKAKEDLKEARSFERMKKKVDQLGIKENLSKSNLDRLGTKENRERTFNKLLRDQQSNDLNQRRSKEEWVEEVVDLGFSEQGAKSMFDKVEESVNKMDALAEMNKTENADLATEREIQAAEEKLRKIEKEKSLIEPVSFVRKRKDRMRKLKAKQASKSPFNREQFILAGQESGMTSDQAGRYFDALEKLYAKKRLKGKLDAQDRFMHSLLKYLNPSDKRAGLGNRKGTLGEISSKVKEWVNIKNEAPSFKEVSDLMKKGDFTSEDSNVVFNQIKLRRSIANTNESFRKSAKSINNLTNASIRAFIYNNDVKNMSRSERAAKLSEFLEQAAGLTPHKARLAAKEFSSQFERRMKRAVIDEISNMKKEFGEFGKRYLYDDNTGEYLGETQPDNIDVKDLLNLIDKAITLHIASPEYGLSESFAALNGWNGYTAKELKRLAEITIELKDKSSTIMERSLLVDELSQISNKFIKDATTAERVIEYYRANILSGLSTLSVNAAAIFGRVLNTLSYIAQGIMDSRSVAEAAAETPRLMRMLFKSYGQGLIEIGHAWKSNSSFSVMADHTTVRKQASRKDWEEAMRMEGEKSPIKVAKYLFKGFPSQISRALNALDSAANLAEHNMAEHVSLLSAFRESGLTRKQIAAIERDMGDVVEQAYDIARNEGMTSLQSKRYAIDVAQDYLVSQGKLNGVSEEEARLMREAALEQGKALTGTQTKEGIIADGTLGGRFFNLVSHLGEAWAQSESKAKQIGGVSLKFAVPIFAIPANFAHRSMDHAFFGGVGALRLYLAKKGDPNFKLLANNPYLYRHRKYNVLVGTAVQTIATAIWGSQLKEDEEDKWLRVNSSSPKDFEARKVWEASGRKAYTIQVRTGKNKWLSLDYSRGFFQVLSPLFYAMGNVEKYQLMQRKITQREAKGIAENEMTFLNPELWGQVALETMADAGKNGLSFLGAMERNGYLVDKWTTERGDQSSTGSFRSWASGVGFKTAGLIPMSGMLRTFNKMSDPRSSNTALQSFIKPLPIIGATDYAGAKTIDFLGNSTRMDGRFWSDLGNRVSRLNLTPGIITTQDQKLYEPFLRRRNIPAPYSPRKFDDVIRERTGEPATDAQYHKYLKDFTSNNKKLARERSSKLDELSRIKDGKFDKEVTSITKSSNKYALSRVIE